MTELHKKRRAAPAATSEAPAVEASETPDVEPVEVVEVVEVVPHNPDVRNHKRVPETRYDEATEKTVMTGKMLTVDDAGTVIPNT